MAKTASRFEYSNGLVVLPDSASVCMQESSIADHVQVRDLLSKAACIGASSGSQFPHGSRRFGRRCALP